MSDQPAGEAARSGPARRPATAAEARTMASPLRLRLLRLCLDQPLTNKQLAERLGLDPASVLYHVRRLVRSGFLAPEPARRGSRGAREVPYRATGKSWTLTVVDPVARRAKNAALVDTFVDDMSRVDADPAYLARLGLRLTPDELDEFTGRLRDLLDEYADRESAGAPWSVFLAVHPDDRPVGNPTADRPRPVSPSEDDD